MVFTVPLVAVSLLQGFEQDMPQPKGRLKSVRGIFVSFMVAPLTAAEKLGRIVPCLGCCPLRSDAEANRNSHRRAVMKVLALESSLGSLFSPEGSQFNQCAGAIS
jgi:hypothetical protein